MKHLVLVLVFMTMFVLTVSAHAQDSVQIHGGTLSCRANNGTIVPLVISEKAIQYSGGFASIDAIHGTSIMLSPTFLNGLPRLAALHLFYHECGHVALPSGVGLGTHAAEKNADCYAVKEMRRAGLITSWQDFTEAMTLARSLPASSMGHLPGEERVNAAAQCLNIPKISASSTVCKELDAVFTGGNIYLGRFDFDRNYNKLITGFICALESNGTGIQCRRDIDDKNERISYANYLAHKITSCLPSEFTYKQSTSMPEFFDSWTNDATNQSVSVHSDYVGQVVLSVVPERQ